MHSLIQNNHIYINGYFCQLTSLENIIYKKLRDAGINTRPANSNGVGCFLLLPTILMLNTCLYQVSPMYSNIAFISIGLLVYSVLFIVFLTVSCLILKEQNYGGCLASSLTSTLLLYSLQKQDLLNSLLLSLITMFLYSNLLRLSLTKSPKTFTVGEAMIVIQGIILFLIMAGAQIVNFRNKINLNNFLIYTVLSTVGLIVTAINLVPDQYKTLQNLYGITTASGALLLIIWHIALGPTCLYQIFVYVFMDPKRTQLCAVWLFLVVVTVLVLLLRTKMAVKANTVTRKSFHILSSLVFLSGILVDVELMKLASGVGLGLLILIEGLRKSNIEPISSVLQSAFLVYSDEKDCGSFAMTPFYLFVGLACPLVLIPPHKNYELELLSGVLSIGVGDTAASWYGFKYGINKWSNSNRTMEGTAFNILSQVAVVYALQLFELLDAKNALIRTAFAATASALVEAKTEQIDNLILPLVTIIAFQFTSFLS